MKIAIYSICKNERPFVDRFLTSCHGADKVVMADTGSTDGTWQRIRQLASAINVDRIALHRVAIDPWRFDTARNVALSLVPPDIDVCVRLDLDEVLDPGWREALEANWLPGTTQLWHWYNFSPGFRYRHNTIHTRFGYHWRGMDHEAIYDATGQGRPRVADDRLSITQLQDRSKDRSSILPRLVLQVQEHKCARSLYYLGREYYYYKQNENAIATLKEYLEEPDATLAQERMDVMSMLAESCERLDLPNNARYWWLRAIAEYPTREPYVGLALFAEQQGEKQLAAGLAAHALTITSRMDNIYNRPYLWNDDFVEAISQRCAG